MAVSTVRYGAALNMGKMMPPVPDIETKGRPAEEVFGQLGRASSV